VLYGCNLHDRFVPVPGDQGIPCQVEARRVLAKRPRWHVHLTPTTSFWLNHVERFFASSPTRRLRRGVYRSVQALRADIMDFIRHHNAGSKPFRWTKSADDILAFHRTLPPLHPEQRLS
jgi:hypothetical protein